MRRFVLVATVTIGLSVGVDAEAGPCSTRPFFSPASGAAVPEGAQIYLFAPLPRYRHQVFDVFAEPDAALTVESLPASSSWLAWRFELRGKAGQQLHVQAKLPGSGRPVAQAIYHVAAAPPESAPAPELREAFFRNDVSGKRWTQASYLIFDRHPAAFRLIWADTQEGLRWGETKAHYFPPRVSARPGTPSQLTLGHVACQGETIESRSGQIFAHIEALASDGSARLVSGGPWRIPRDPRGVPVAQARRSGDTALPLEKLRAWASIPRGSCPFPRPAPAVPTRARRSPAGAESSPAPR